MKTLYPYDVLVGEVGISVSRVAIDGKSLSTNFINPDLLEIAFAELDQGWNTATIRFSVIASPAELASNSSWVKPEAMIQVSSSKSKVRQSILLMADPHTPGRWVGNVELDRRSFYDRAAIRGVMYATVDGISHRMIGHSDTWTVLFDDLPSPPVHGSIRILWSDFANDSDRPYLEAFQTDPYYLHMDLDDPTLFLNRAFDGLEALLVDRKLRPGPELALHDSTRVSFAGDVWTAMFVAALSAVELDPETQLPEWPPEGWREIVLRSLLTRIYPDVGPEDALFNAIQDRDSGDGASDLMERLLPAAARQVRGPQLLRKGIGLLGAASKEGDT